MVRINEVNANVTAGTCDMIELRVVSGGTGTRTRSAIDEPRQGYA